jgi:hypothetical protein
MSKRIGQGLLDWQGRIFQVGRRERGLLGVGTGQYRAGTHLRSWRTLITAVSFRSNWASLTLRNGETCGTPVH